MNMLQPNKWHGYDEVSIRDHGATKFSRGISTKLHKSRKISRHLKIVRHGVIWNTNYLIKF